MNIADLTLDHVPCLLVSYCPLAWWRLELLSGTLALLSNLKTLLTAREDKSPVGISTPCFCYLFNLPHFDWLMGLCLCSICSRYHWTFFVVFISLSPQWTLGFYLDEILTRPWHIFKIHPDFHVSLSILCPCLLITWAEQIGFCIALMILLNVPPVLLFFSSWCKSGSTVRITFYKQEILITTQWQLEQLVWAVLQVLQKQLLRGWWLCKQTWY